VLAISYEFCFFFFAVEKKARNVSKYVVGRFEDGKVANFPLGNVVPNELGVEVDQTRFVKLSDGKKYEVKIMCIGEWNA